MKLLRLYFLGFLLCFEVFASSYQAVKEEFTILFEEEIDCLFSMLSSNELVQDSFLILQS